MGKKWVPLIFEQRKNRLLSRYLEENSAETLGFVVPDLEKLEAMFPLLVVQPTKHRVGQRRHSKIRENTDDFADSRRCSTGSNPPSYRLSRNTSREDSVGSKANSKGRSGRRGSMLDPKDL